MRFVVYFLLAVVFTLGLVDLMRSFRFWLLKPLETPPIVVELTLTNADECEYQLRAVLERLRWLRAPVTLRVKCVNAAGSREMDAVVRRFAARYRCIEYERMKWDEPLSCGTEEDRG